MAKNSDDANSMSQESIDYLDDVKKGKPRRFAMICKGTSVVSLVVFKKGSIEQRRKEAKESGKGQFYFGIIDGKGVDMRFALARVDGFESAPVKDTVLKAYLAETAELKVKPHFEIVDQLPELVDEEDEAPATQQTPATVSSTEPVQQPADSIDDPASKLVAALKAIKPLLDQATAVHPNREAELKAAFIGVSSAIKERQFDQAKASLTSLAGLLKSLAAVKVPETPNDQMLRFRERCDALQPSYAAARDRSPEKAVKLQAVWDYAQAQATAGNFENAFKALDKLTAVLNQPNADSGTAEDFPTRWKLAATQWRDANEEVDSQISRLQQALKQTNDPELLEIAEFGLNALTRGTKVKLLSAIHEVTAASTAITPGLLASAKKAVVAFRQQIKTDERVEACDENPFGVSVSIRDTLGPALNGLESVLNSAN